LSGAPSGAGTYTVVAAFAGSADYTAVSATTILTIAKATPKIAVSETGDTYNGQPFPAKATVAGVVAGFNSTPAASLEGVSQTFTYYVLNADGTQTFLTGAPSIAGRYEVDAVFADYTAASRSATFTIKKSSPSFSLLTSATIL
jgi:large repetitive protein